MIAYCGNFLVKQFGTLIFFGIFTAFITANNGFSTIFGYFFRYVPMPLFSTGLITLARCLFMSMNTRCSFFHRALKSPFNAVNISLILSNVINKLARINNLNFLHRGLVID